MRRERAPYRYQNCLASETTPSEPLSDHISTGVCSRFAGNFHLTSNSMRSTNGSSAIKAELAASVALHGKRCPSCSLHLPADGYHKNRSALLPLGPHT